MKYQDALIHISKPSEKLRVRCLYALSGMTQAQLELFRDLWPEIKAERRRLVIRRLVELTEESFEVNFDPVFLLAMGDADDEVRAAAIDGLWENEDRRLIDPLIYLLKSDNAAAVRAAAATALGRFVLLGELEKLDSHTSVQVEDALRATIKDAGEPVDVRRRAVESIAYSSKPHARRIIREAYYSEDDKMRGSALFAMGRSADPYWRHLLIPELESDRPENRFEAARACGELELARAVPRLGDMAVNDADPEVQQAAVWALGNIGGKEARRILESCCEGDDEALSEAAADALDEMGLLGADVSLPLYGDLEDDLDDEDADSDGDDEQAA
jgi:HEAT repeat protein